MLIEFIKDINSPSDAELTNCWEYLTVENQSKLTLADFQFTPILIDWFASKKMPNNVLTLLGKNHSQATSKSIKETLEAIACKMEILLVYYLKESQTEQVNALQKPMEHLYQETEIFFISPFSPASATFYYNTMLFFLQRLYTNFKSGFIPNQAPLTQFTDQQAILLFAEKTISQLEKNANINIEKLHYAKLSFSFFLLIPLHFNSFADNIEFLNNHLRTNQRPLLTAWLLRAKDYIKDCLNHYQSKEKFQNEYHQALIAGINIECQQLMYKALQETDASPDKNLATINQLIIKLKEVVSIFRLFYQKKKTENVDTELLFLMGDLLHDALYSIHLVQLEVAKHIYCSKKEYVTDYSKNMLLIIDLLDEVTTVLDIQNTYKEKITENLLNIFQKNFEEMTAFEAKIKDFDNEIKDPIKNHKPSLKLNKKSKDKKSEIQKPVANKSKQKISLKVQETLSESDSLIINFTGRLLHHQEKPKKLQTLLKNKLDQADKAVDPIRYATISLCLADSFFVEANTLTKDVKLLKRPARTADEQQADNDERLNIRLAFLIYQKAVTHYQTVLSLLNDNTITTNITYSEARIEQLIQNAQWSLEETEKKVNKLNEKIDNYLYFTERLKERLINMGKYGCNPDNIPIKKSYLSNHVSQLRRMRGNNDDANFSEKNIANLQNLVMGINKLKTSLNKVLDQNNLPAQPQQQPTLLGTVEIANLLESVLNEIKNDNPQSALLLLESKLVIHPQFAIFYFPFDTSKNTNQAIMKIIQLSIEKGEKIYQEAVQSGDKATFFQAQAFFNLPMQLEALNPYHHFNFARAACGSGDYPNAMHGFYHARFFACPAHLSFIDIARDCYLNSIEENKNYRYSGLIAALPIISPTYSPQFFQPNINNHNELNHTQKYSI